MDNKALAAKDAVNNENKKKIHMMKFCIISNFKSQFCRNNLMMFTLDNNN